LKTLGRLGTVLLKDLTAAQWHSLTSSGYVFAGFSGNDAASTPEEPRTILNYLSLLRVTPIPVDTKAQARMRRLKRKLE
jgi:hypothetical protein